MADQRHKNFRYVFHMEYAHYSLELDPIKIDNSLTWDLEPTSTEIGRFSLPDDDEVYWGEGRIIK